ncbi:MAG: hypothetical protein D6729_02875 [Deltaproteobacteria bacterium]|nr:MAG: hypothetical protein D6729_02875 [Deltaproteobacteria bacterium]
MAGDGAADAEGDTADGEGDTPGDLTESSVEKPPAEDSPGLAKGNTGDETAPAAEPIPEPLVMHAPPARTGQPPAADASPSDSDLGETDWAREEPPPVTEPQPYVMPGERPGHLPPLFRLPVVSVRAVAKTTQRAYSLEGQFTRVNYAMGSFEFFPELGLAVDAFPLSTLGGAVEGLGVSGRFTRGFLVSQFADQAGQLQRLDTPVQRWHADLRYLFRFAPAQRASTALGVRLGYGVSEFLVPVANAVFTGVHHGGLRAGLELRQPLFPPFAVLEVRAVALPLVQPGADEARYYGPNASGFGWQVAGGLYGGTRIVGRGIVYGLWGELTGYLDTFQGTGTRDTDARAQESYVSLGMSLGYAY